MKRLSLLLLSLLCTAATAFAYDFQSGDLYYNITGENTVEVTYQERWSENNYKGLTTTTIPKTIIYNGTTYSVTSIGDRAFEDCSSLTSVTIPNSITSIGDVAFGGCSSLTSITIPNSVTSIGNSAFNSCSSLTSITIPNSVTSIGSGAFGHCSSLTSVTIGSGVKTIGDDAFIDCDALTKTNYTGDIAGWCAIEFENYQTNYRSNPIRYSKNLFINDVEVKDLVIPNSVTSIGYLAFYRCSSLTSVTIGNSVISIGGYAFSHSGLTSITIGSGVTSIGSYAFSYCSALTSITIPNSVTSIGEGAFKDCSSLTSVTIGRGVKTIESNAFLNCDALTKTNYTGDIADWCAIKFESLSFCNPIYYSQNLFINDVEVKDLVIPDSVTSIEWYAFKNCKSLTSVTIGSGVKTIGKSAFSNCTGISRLSVPNNVTKIGSSAFNNLPLVLYAGTATGSPWGAKKVGGYVEGNIVYDSDKRTKVIQCDIAATGEIVLPESVTAIGNEAFYECSALTSVTIGSGVKTIGKSAFSYCTGISRLSVPYNVTTIGYDAFYDLPLVLYAGTATGSPWGAKKVGGYIEGNIVYDSDKRTKVVQCDIAATGEIVLPKSVTTIEDEAFRGCTAITSVVIPDSVTSIGNSVFYNCTALTSVTIPDSVTSIGNSAFYNCKSLTSVTIGNSITSIARNAFSGCSNLTSVIWNAKNCAITSRTRAPFYGISSNITSFTFGEEVETIPSYLCYGMTNLTAINIPNSVTSIGNTTFGSCSQLLDIYCYAATPPLAQTNSFANYNASLHVPCESLEAYNMDAVFGSFKEVACIDSEDVVITDNEVTVVSGNDEATFTWPITDGADSYSLVITKDSETFCTLVFNAQGQLLSIAFKPTRQNTPAEEGTTPANYAEQTSNGFRFTVTGLDEGTDYAYTLTVRDAANSVLETYTGEFTTLSNTPTGISDSPDPTETASDKAATKLLRDGQVLILRNGETYDMMGQRLQ